MKKIFHSFIGIVILLGLYLGSSNLLKVNAVEKRDEPLPEPNINNSNKSGNSDYLSTSVSENDLISYSELFSENDKNVDFENLNNYDVVGNFYNYLGVEFVGAVVLGQGESLNYLQFPPHSGVNVVYDYPDYIEPGKITIIFDSNVAGYVNRVGGYITGNRNVSMTAYDDNGYIIDSVETGGANCCDIGTPNKLLEITTSTNISTVVFFNGGERGNTYTVDDFFFTSEQTCSLNDVPYYSQLDPNWGNDDYGGSVSNPWGPGENSFWRWGCATTSAAMIISYHGLQQNGFTTTPKELNDWLRSDDVRGYSEGSIIWTKVAEYARLNGVNLHYYSGWSSNDGVVNGFLCENCPIILYTKTSPYDGHFLVATGRTQDGDWKVNDPGYYDLSTIGNSEYTEIRKYGISESDPSSIYIAAHSPLVFLITDPAGRRTGFDPSTNTNINEILDSDYSFERLYASDGSFIESLIFSTGSPISGKYKMTIFGTGSGPFDIDFLVYDEDGNPGLATISGNTFLGEIINVEIEYSDSSASQLDVVMFPPIINFIPLLTR